MLQATQKLTLKYFTFQHCQLKMILFKNRKQEKTYFQFQANGSNIHFCNFDSVHGVVLTLNLLSLMPLCISLLLFMLKLISFRRRSAMLHLGRAEAAANAICMSCEAVKQLFDACCIIC